VEIVLKEARAKYLAGSLRHLLFSPTGLSDIHDWRKS